MAIDLTTKRILVTGGAGFLGSHLVERLQTRGVPTAQITIPRSRDCDLRTWSACERIVRGQDIIIHLAARVGGIGYNRDHPGELYYDNLMMGAQLLEAARRAGTGKFIAIGTICAYPKLTPVPFREETIWDGYPEETNAPYGLAKKMLLVQAQAYRQQYQFNAISLFPTNLYGPRDNFDLTNSHVIPALIRKVDEAQRRGDSSIVAWGTGQATREFLYVTDAAEAIILATEQYDGIEPVNLGSGQEISICKLLTLICQLMAFPGEIHWDTTKPDGQPRRCLDVSRAERAFGFRARQDFEAGLRETITWYRSERPQ